MTLCVARGRRASRKACDAKRRTIIGLSAQTDAELQHDSGVRLSFLA
ncbi:hypothetical protein ALO45_200242 [Pseudomonas syringae pv. syringae]|nr:hypothetical protein ALO45_200242 [Pseudomonas syringae pv. syringae]